MSNPTSFPLFPKVSTTLKLESLSYLGTQDLSRAAGANKELRKLCFNDRIWWPAMIRKEFPNMHISILNAPIGEVVAIEAETESATPATKSGKVEKDQVPSQHFRKVMMAASRACSTVPVLRFIGSSRFDIDPASPALKNFEENYQLIRKINGKIIDECLEMPVPYMFKRPLEDWLGNLPIILETAITEEELRFFLQDKPKLTKVLLAFYMICSEAFKELNQAVKQMPIVLDDKDPRSFSLSELEKHANWQEKCNSSILKFFVCRIASEIFPSLQAPNKKYPGLWDGHDIDPSVLLKLLKTFVISESSEKDKRAAEYAYGPVFKEFEELYCALEYAERLLKDKSLKTAENRVEQKGNRS